MEEVNESSRRRRIKMENLLQRFITSSTNSNNTIKPKQEPGEEDEEIELNLGLSLGGRFGVDKTPPTKLFRSTSVASSIPMLLESNGDDVAFMSPAALIRTSSLPTETEEEWRKRKELQSLRRLEAKRRRSEKMRSSKEVVGGVVVRQSCGPVDFGDKGKGCFLRQLNSQGSVESQGGAGSSGMSDFESKPVQGSTSGGERSPVSNHTKKQEPRNQETMESLRVAEHTPKRPDISECPGRKNSGMSAMDEMPCVFTKGEGPNGRRIDGILYKYGKGEAVRIMCVCHGSFLSPAEFVKHAGGGDVAHPLRHIVVNPSSNSPL